MIVVRNSYCRIWSHGIFQRQQQMWVMKQSTDGNYNNDSGDGTGLFFCNKKKEKKLQLPSLLEKPIHRLLLLWNKASSSRPPFSCLSFFFLVLWGMRERERDWRGLVCRRFERKMELSFIGIEGQVYFWSRERKG